MYLPAPNSRIRAPRKLRGMGATLDDLAAAITRMEGSCSAPGVCQNNNPGNLRAYAPGQAVDSRGIRIFPDYQSGYAALLAQEQANINRGLTLSEFFGGKSGVYSGYAPAADSNNPDAYAGNVASWLGIPSDVPLSSIFGGGYGSGSDSTVAADDLSSTSLLDAVVPEGIDPWLVGGIALLGIAAVLALS